MKPFQHVYALWGNWWPLAFAPLVYLAAITVAGDTKPEHMIIVGIITVMALVNTRTKSFLIAVLPGVAIGFGNEVVRYLRPVFLLPERVLGCDLRALELSLFSFGGQWTMSDYFDTHHSPFFDVFFAIPYTAFWMVAVGYAIFLFFHNRALMQRYLWLLALVYTVTFFFWTVFPAAPPWYLQAYGCTIDIDVLPSAAGLARIDAMFGITYFESFYSRAPTVFGALPSMHCAFPVVGLLAAWRSAGWPERVLHLTYSVWMLAGSIYLLHHWLLDGLLGIAIVVVSHIVLTRLLPLRFETADNTPA